MVRTVNKKVSMFGRKISAALLGLVIVAGLAMAGLLNYYGQVVGTATVSQSVQVSENNEKWLTCSGSNGEGCKIEDSFSVTAGDTVYREYYVRNNAEVNATIKIDDINTPEEVNELAVAIVNVGTQCNGEGVSYTSLLGENYLQVTLESNETKKICEKVTFKINTLAGNYPITIGISPA